MKIFRTVFFLFVAYGFSLPAQAGPVVGTANISGITVGDRILDLRFSEASYTSLFGTSNPFFMGDANSALLATMAIISALETNPSAAGSLPPTTFPIFVPYAVDINTSGPIDLLTVDGFGIRQLPGSDLSYHLTAITAVRQMGIGEHADTYAIFEQVGIVSPPVVTRTAPVPGIPEELPEPSVTVPAPGTGAILLIGLVALMRGRRPLR